MYIHRERASERGRERENAKEREREINDPSLRGVN